MAICKHMYACIKGTSKLFWVFLSKHLHGFLTRSVVETPFFAVEHRTQSILLGNVGSSLDFRTQGREEKAGNAEHRQFRSILNEV